MSVTLDHVASHARRQTTSPNMERRAGWCLVAPFWHEAKSKCTTNRKKKGTKKSNPRLRILLLFLLGRIYPIPVQGKKVKLQKLFKSECGCGMQALALIRAIFPLSHSGPIMLKSFTDSHKEWWQCAAEQKQNIAVWDHLRADGALAWHPVWGILCHHVFWTGRNTFRSNLA